MIGRSEPFKLILEVDVFGEQCAVECAEESAAIGSCSEYFHDDIINKRMMKFTTSRPLLGSAGCAGLESSTPCSSHTNAALSDDPLGKAMTPKRLVSYARSRVS